MRPGSASRSASPRSPRSPRICRRVPAGNGPSAPALSGPDPATDPVQPEGAPIVAIKIEGDEVPAVAAVDDGGRLDAPPGEPIVARHVGEAQADPVTARTRERGQQIGIDAWSLGGER